MRSHTLLLLLPLPVIGIAVSMPKLQPLYDNRRFVAPLAAGLALLALAAIAMASRAIPGPGAGRRAAWLAAIVFVAGALTWSIFRTNPVRASALREVIHIGEYGLIGAITVRHLEKWIASRLGYLVAVAYGSMVAIVDELVQFHHPIRTGDVRDVLADMGSCAIGIAFVAGVQERVFSPGGGRTERRLTAFSISLVGSALLFFLGTVHCGYLVTDPRFGSFRSYFTATELRKLASRDMDEPRYRALQARDTTRPVFAMRNFYLFETRNHILHRGRPAPTAKALLENSLLETYYRPAMLALDGRWPEQEVKRQRSELRQQGGRLWQSAQTYVSPVSPWVFTRAPPRVPLALSLLLLLVGLVAARLLP